MKSLVSWFDTIPTLLVLMTLVTPVRAEGTTATQPACAATTQPAAALRREESGPICGLYCLWAAMQSYGHEVDFRALLKPKYAGTLEGSSLTELKNAAEDHGMQAAILDRLASYSLSASPCPIILHVKSDVNKKPFDHYELFLGVVDGKAKLLDPPGPIRLIPFHELATRWDGKGLAVSTGQIDVGRILKPARIRLLAYAGVGVGLVLLVHWLSRKRRLPPADTMRKRLELAGLQVIVLATLSILIGTTFHLVHAEGFLARAGATASVEKAHCGDFMSKVDKEDVRKMLNTDTVFVDARYRNDFARGHLDGAINIPVISDDQTRRQALAGIGTDRRIVIYCQSAGCKFAETVGGKLVEDGYMDVCLYKGGWMDWSQTK